VRHAKDKKRASIPFYKQKGWGLKMRNINLSLKALTIALLSFIGLASILLSLYAGNIYKDAAKDEEYKLLSRIVGVASQEVLRQLERQARNLGSSAQKTATFRKAIKSINSDDNKQVVTDLLDDQFAQRFVTSGILHLRKLRVYDIQLQYLAESTQGDTDIPAQLPEFLYKQAKQRQGADRLKALSGVWLSPGGAVYSVLVPIGGLRLVGYMEVLTDPALNLQTVENIVHAPLRIFSAEQQQLFLSENWPTKLDDTALIVDYNLYGEDEKHALRLEVVEDIQSFNQVFSETTLVNVGTSIAIILFALAISFVMFSKFVFKPLQQIIEHMEYCVQGGLDRNVTPSGLVELQKLGSSLALLIRNLQSHVSEIKETSLDLSNTSQDLHTLTASVEKDINDQQLQTEQIATSITEMSASVQEVARYAEMAADTARETDEETNVGKKVMGDTISRINSLSVEFERTTDAIHKLEVDSENIGSVVDVIRSIAEQTNLLALNAAIEAARAGEQGRGFAVVADEVRVLASRTQESTLEIQETVERLQAGTRQSVKAMSESRDEVRVTVEHAAEAEKTLHSITVAVAKIADMNLQIATAAEQQATVASAVDQHVAHISDIAHRSADGAVNTAKSSDRLFQLSEKLTDMVRHFKT